MDADQLLTPEDAALFLAVQPDTLAHWRNRGIGPVFRKIGRAVRYRRGDLIAFSDARAFSNTVEARNYAPEAV
jgi:hypothetical protein